MVSQQLIQLYIKQEVVYLYEDLQTELHTLQLGLMQIILSSLRQVGMPVGERL